MLRRLFLTLTFALLFGLGQQGALLHELSHLDDLAPASQQQDKAPHSPVCSKCLGYGELANAIAVGLFIIPILVARHGLIQHAASVNYALSSNAYSARAPPQSS